jgi:23S rRNA (pseudouridine1915-N3)-methyltransferase
MDGAPGIAFVIGGPDGLNAEIAARADLMISFGRMTMPHQLVRVLVLEQLYRAATILAGHPYHRA